MRSARTAHSGSSHLRSTLGRPERTPMMITHVPGAQIRDVPPFRPLHRREAAGRGALEPALSVVDNRLPAKE